MTTVDVFERRHNIFIPASAKARSEVARAAVNPAWPGCAPPATGGCATSACGPRAGDEPCR
ncbi:MAG: hypothetical protein F4X66_09390 [Chloroflexi bacterium]|nr:hypothetical protein [Chloroflexota bacterium]MYE41255.1 hypothetical protein [Chloroflexota bacterium]